MAAVVTTEGLALFAKHFADGTELIINSVQIGTLGSADRYDAVVANTALVDTTPTLYDTVIDAKNEGARVVYTVSFSGTSAVVGSEVGLFSGSSLVFLWADQSANVFSKAVDSNALISIVVEYSSGTITSVTITQLAFAFATEDEERAGLITLAASTPGGRQAWYTALEIDPGKIDHTKGVIDYRAIPRASHADARRGNSSSVFMTPYTTVTLVSVSRLNATNVTSGTLHRDRLPRIPVSLLDGKISSSNLPDIGGGTQLASDISLSPGRPTTVSLRQSMDNFNWVIFNSGAADSVQNETRVVRVSKIGALTRSVVYATTTTQNNILYNINLSTGVATQAAVGGTLPEVRLEAAAVLPGGSVYVGINESLYLFNPGSGRYSLIRSGIFRGLRTEYSLAWHRGELLYGTNTGIGKIDLRNNTLGSITRTPGDVRAMVSHNGTLYYTSQTDHTLRYITNDVTYTTANIGRISNSAAPFPESMFIYNGGFWITSQTANGLHRISTSDASILQTVRITSPAGLNLYAGFATVGSFQFSDNLQAERVTSTRLNVYTSQSSAYIHDIIGLK